MGVDPHRARAPPRGHPRLQPPRRPAGERRRRGQEGRRARPDVKVQEEMAARQVHARVSREGGRGGARGEGPRGDVGRRVHLRGRGIHSQLGRRRRR